VAERKLICHIGAFEMPRDAQVEEIDVLVVGGGTAGFGAAVAAGRKGLNVMMIEATSKVGGVMAFCPGMPWGAAYPANQIVGGLIGELTHRLESMTPPAAEKRPCTLDNFGPEIIYDHDIATLTMFTMLEQANVDVRLNCTAIEPVMAGSKITSVHCCDRNGVFSVKPQIVLDCSGDGDISAKAGVPFAVGDNNGNTMGVTCSFHMINVDWNQVFADDDPYFTSHAAKGIAEGRLHPDLAKLYLMKAFHHNTVFCNSVHVRGVNGMNPSAITQATQEGRRRCHQLAKFLIASVPGFEQAHMSMLSPTVGVRETRKLQAVYQLTGKDLASNTKFADGIVCCDNPIDDVMRDSADMTHEAIVTSGNYYSIPFRSLVPVKIENLLFAGRIICADPIAFASVRGMPQCMTMGQAIGTAASMAIKNRSRVQAVETGQLVQELISQGVNGLGHHRLG
jgi:hypothetical protein